MANFTARLVAGVVLMVSSLAVMAATVTHTQKQEVDLSGYLPFSQSGEGRSEVWETLTFNFDPFEGLSGINGTLLDAVYRMSVVGDLELTVSNNAPYDPGLVSGFGRMDMLFRNPEDYSTLFSSIKNLGSRPTFAGGGPESVSSLVALDGSGAPDLSFRSDYNTLMEGFTSGAPSLELTFSRIALVSDTAFGIGPVDHTNITSMIGVPNGLTATVELDYVYEPAAVVPLPPALWMMGAAVAGLLAVARKRRAA